MPWSPRSGLPTWVVSFLLFLNGCLVISKNIVNIGKMGEYSGKSSINDGNRNIPSGW